MSRNSALPVLPIHPFEAAGVFNCHFAATHDLADPIFDVQTSAISCSARYLAEFKVLEVTCGGVIHDIMIDESSHRRFFVCNCCVQRRVALILEGGRFMCRETYQTSGKAYSKAIRSAQFAMAIDDLREEQPKAILRAPKRPFSYHVADPIPVETLKARRRQLYYSTKKAIELGRGAAQYRLYGIHYHNDREHWELIKPDADYDYPESSSLTTEHPRLEINIFREYLLRSRGQFVARTLCWGERSGPHKEVLFLVDWRDDGLPIVIAAHDFLADDGPRLQRLPLARQASGRFRWICPALGRRCDVLYLRDGSFGSRKAQWLFAPSQRASGRAMKRSD